MSTCLACRDNPVTDTFTCGPCGDEWMVEFEQQKRPRQRVNAVTRSLTAIGAAMSKVTPRNISMDSKILEMLDIYPQWLEDRIFPYLDGHPGDGCWTWTRGASAGYGRTRRPSPAPRRESSVQVHRLVWLALRGPIEPGLVLDHDGHCSNRLCSNPSHLQAVTPRQNILDTGSGTARMHTLKTCCPKGHPYGDDNNVPNQRALGHRSCWTCAKRNNYERSEACRQAAATLGMKVTDYRNKFGSSRQRALAVISGAQL